MADGAVVTLTERPEAKYRWKMKQGHNEIKLSTAQMFALTAEFMSMQMPHVPVSRAMARTAAWEETQ